MAEGNTQKLKILYLMKYLLEKTDETHSVTIQNMIEELGRYGIRAERKSLYNDIENLKLFGIDVIGIKENRTFNYHVGNRTFELAELKLLVDSVQSAKFITEKKSNELIKKIESFASEYERKQLHRQVYISERIKTENESIYYNVDQIHAAIGENMQITFQYFNWDVNKKQVLRKDGALYQVSPWALSWDDENYYLVAFDDKEDKIKHFRVDKMLHIEMTRDRRKGASVFRSFDMGAYAKKMFGMFDGEEEYVQIKCENYLAGVIIDRFGKDVAFIKTDADHFNVNVKVAVSRQFISWVMALGEGAKIIGPESVLEKINEEVTRMVRQYGVKRRRYQ
ncbi:helix-turn-helix transcriptional regulator [Anaerosporobacter faecicola]|uniref:helix-turn-helix transcriptional regulator n=1 Tax=Anaerosporobacter faecicola TaxID=2718714 RepID=UPI001438ECF0|nr:WYL domain-containing protein [Anaerosporobacter faecicola]